MSGPLLPSLGLNKSSTSAPKQASHLVIFGGPRSKSRQSLFVEPCILHSFVPTSRTLLRSGLHNMLTSSSVQNAFKDVRRSTYWTYIPFVCNINYNQRLSILKLLPLCYWHEFLDVLFLFKSHNDIVNLSSDIQPNPQYSRQHTRSANPNGLQFQISSCKTATYQKSYLLWTTRVWNILPRDLTNNGLTFKEFKKNSFNYHSSALDNCYDVDDPRTWKLVCIKCNQARDLTRPITCYF